MELEADNFAGLVLYKLGATLEQTIAIFATIDIEESRTHPSKTARIEATTNGWIKAKDSK